MHYVILAEHSPEVCPTSNAKTKELLLGMGPQIPKIAEKHEVRIISGPFVNHEHISVMIVETEQAQSLDRFLAETRLPQWNRVRVLPSLPIEEGMKDVTEAAALF